MHCSPSRTPSMTCDTAFCLVACKVERVRRWSSSLTGDYVPFSLPA
jgi:hypothetical protein